jgi:tetratricopeptide (TPR) repeat protein
LSSVSPDYLLISPSTSKFYGNGSPAIFTTCFLVPHALGTGYYLPGTCRHRITGQQEIFRAGAREFDLRNYQEAMRLFKQAISSDKGFYEAYLMAGEVYFELNDFRQAVAYYEKAVSINPDFFPMIYFNMGNAWMALGSYEEAKKAYGSWPVIPRYLRDTGRLPGKKLKAASLQ